MLSKRRPDGSDTIAEAGKHNRRRSPRTRSVSPLLPLAALTGCTCWAAARIVLALLRRHLRLVQHSPPGAASPAGAGGAPAARLPNLATFDATHPEKFFLPDSALAALADCFAVVEGVRLPLHSQVSTLMHTPLLPQRASCFCVRSAMFMRLHLSFTPLWHAGRC